MRVREKEREREKGKKGEERKKGKEKKRFSAPKNTFHVSPVSSLSFSNLAKWCSSPSHMATSAPQGARSQEWWPLHSRQAPAPLCSGHLQNALKVPQHERRVVELRSPQPRDRA